MDENIKKLIHETFSETSDPVNGKIIWYNSDLITESEFYCNNCLDGRKMKVINVKMREDRYVNVYKNFEEGFKKNLPLVYELECLQCKSRACLVIQKMNNEIKDIILYETYGGCSSKNSPDGVKYYLNEAKLSKQIGAKSASMAMYRAALDFLLYEQGYTQGMLGNKIKKLEEDRNNNCGQKWVMEIEPQFLEVIKDIGNSSIHPNDGNIKCQEVIDENLLNIVDIVFSELLDKIYEQPIRSKKNLELLKNKKSALNMK